ncbi:hypothetical protein ACO34A_06810 [Rhizobium sp. ACO-34A]|nr:hypothetical protein ACO34A_06810 [Rhizobium sp. ACO-34A]
MVAAAHGVFQIRPKVDLFRPVNSPMMQPWRIGPKIEVDFLEGPMRGYRELWCVLCGQMGARRSGFKTSDE